VKVQFRGSFAKDLRKVKKQTVKQQIKEAIKAVEDAASLQELSDLKKLRVGDRYYRIRVGEYRIGILFEANTVIFVRLLPRKDIYRYFP